MAFFCARLFAPSANIRHTPLMAATTATPPYALLAAFTGPGCAGNQALVVCHRQALGSTAMQAMAQTLLARHPATACAFVSPMSQEANTAADYQLRSFHASGEILLCGHAALCAAHWLWQQMPRAQPLRFHLPACRQQLLAERHGEEICLELPANFLRPAQPPAGLAALLKGEIRACAHSQTLPGSLLVELTDERALRQFQPRAEALLAISRDCLLLTAASAAPDIDIVSRYFTPAYGALEDPATGSAHAMLAIWWRQRLGDRPLHCLQASPAGGWLRIQQHQQGVRLWAQCTTIPIIHQPL